jgi:probable F420-dependent oxidoreductase
MNDQVKRLGFTLPIEGLDLLDHREVITEAERRGYTDAWTGETDRTDAFTPLALAAGCTETMRLGTGIASVFTRGPALLAMTAASMSELAPGRFCLGLGASSDVIVGRWNSMPFERPLTRVREMTHVVRDSLAGEKVTREGETMAVKGFRLSRIGNAEVPIFIAALRAGMLRLAGSIGDGVLLNWLGAGDIPQALAEVERGRAEAGRSDRVESAVRIFICPGEEAQAEYHARRYIAAYMNVPVYRKYQQWLGRGELLAPMNEAWADKRRREATELIPDQVLRDLVLFGDRDSVRAGIQSYFDNGADTVILHFLPTVDDPLERAEQCVEALMDYAPGAVTT